MSTIKHHLTDALLMGYSAGSLPEAFNLIVATHISVCDECRARMAEFDALGGEVMMCAETVDMDDRAFEKTLRSLMNESEDVAPAPTKRSVGVFPAPLRDYVGGDLDAVRWRKVGGGVRQMILKTDGEATARLLYIPSGVAVPDHGHNGVELTLVLQGAFSDELDSFGVGDIEVTNEDIEHTPIAMGDMDCICLAVTDAPLRFSGLIPRLAQPFLRI